jgi:hypothetical protein
VRITAQLAVTGGSGDTYIRLKPNGLASMSTNSIGGGSYIGAGPGYSPTVLGPEFGGAVATSPGIVIGAARYSSGVGDVLLWGTLSTNRAKGALATWFLKQWVGQYSNIERASDANEQLVETIASRWHDNSTPITSLTLSADSGTLTGRIVVEQLP